MKRKLVTILLAAAGALCLCLGLAACDGENGNDGSGSTAHAHSWSTAYTQDGDRHYQTCSECGDKNYSTHDYGTSGVCVCGAEQPEAGHSHNYNRQVATQDYLKSAANCTKGNIYYYSCECGERSSDTFESGSPTGIHVFVEEVTETYLKRAGTCMRKAVYYKSCEGCGLQDSETFEYGNPPMEHNYGADDICTNCPMHRPSDGLEYTVNENTAAVTGIGTCADSAIHIADYYQGKPVVNIGACAFHQNEKIKSVSIPDEVTDIERAAFFDCGNLASVAMSNEVLNIRANAFAFCSNLASITIPDSVTYVGNSAFNGCRKLQYNEYDNAYYLGNADNPYALLFQAKNRNITSCIIHQNTKIIYDSAFSYCINLTNMIIPDKVVSIGSDSFECCANLKTITIPDGILNVNIYAFRDCTNLQYNEYNNVLYLGNANKPYLVLAGAKDWEITSCAIHSDTKIIAGGSLARCTNLASIIVPNGVIIIGNMAFEACSSLTSITISESVSTLDDYAFYGCTGLTDIIYQGTKNQWDAIQKGNGWDFYMDNYVIHCSDGDITVNQ